jgi:hypothetical protein
MGRETHCSRCECRISEDEERWAFEEPYCDDCFGTQFSYCERCDTLIHAADGNYMQDTCYCDECYDKDFCSDDDAPDNPVILPMDREEIVNLCREWLSGKSRKKRHPLRINRNHFELDKIMERVGRVSRPVYVYGLLDRTQYDFCISPDLRIEVNEFLILNGIYWKYFEIEGFRRLGFCKRLRYGEFESVVKLLKYLCKARKKALA